MGDPLFQFIVDTCFIILLVFAFIIGTFGTNNKYYGVKEYERSVGYGLEELKSYDSANKRWIPHPTKFGEGGWPIYADVEDWEIIPDFGVIP
jgi:hypothetical protein